MSLGSIPARTWVRAPPSPGSGQSVPGAAVKPVFLTQTAQGRGCAASQTFNLSLDKGVNNNAPARARSKRYLVMPLKIPPDDSYILLEE